MEQLFALMKFYNSELVFLSILIAALGSYVSLELVERFVRAKQLAVKKRWGMIGAAAMGLSVWAMHFTGMSALGLQAAVSYNWTLTLLSILPAGVAAYIAFAQLSHSEFGHKQLLRSSLLMGAGIVAMHYSGMAAIRYGGEIQYSPVSLAASVLIAVSVSYVAMLLFRLFRKQQSYLTKAGIAVLMGLAISSMHYTAMGGTSFCMPESAREGLFSEPIFQNQALGIGVVAAILLILLFVGGMVMADWRYYRQIAYYDVLTGLPNRKYMEEKWLQKQVGSKDNQSAWNLYLIDIDRFEWINNSVGHTVGDELLHSFAERLQQIFPSGAVVKLEGNLFAAAHTADVQQQAQEIAQVCKEPFLIQGHEILLTVSTGIALNRKDAKESSILDEAVIALEYSKNEGRNRYTVYDPLLHSRSRETAIGYQMRKALLQNEFYLHYQPKVNLATGEIDSVEALVRWRSPVFGFVSPGEFIPIAEKNGMIGDLTDWVLEQACLQMQEWLTSGSSIQRIAVNLSAIHFQFDRANDRILEIIEKKGVPPQCLELEITETAVMQDVSRAIQMIAVLREKGIRIALDDFGTGVSSLNYLKLLPIDTLKIDKSFIDYVGTEEKDQAILATIVNLAKHLDFQVVAEGIEQEKQAAFLQQIGCQYGQGYYFSKPLPAQEIPLLTVQKL